ncbi:MAG TPA: aldehyde dehydrogenase family protein [Acidimicrobiia bacterium]|nr:aldehyde dehydrogenase family protein [Acidimicrobiia bacterium]
MQDRDKLYIDGSWVPSAGSDTIDVINAATEEVMGRVPDGTPADVDQAVAAARRAFPAWSATPVDERAKYLQRLSEGLGARSDEIAATVSGEVGMPLMWSKMIQAGLPTAVMGSYVDIANNFTFEEQVGNSLVVREPVGVVGCITPWNYPLHQIVAKVAPALAAGCTVVLKPSEVAPLSAFILAEIVDDVGLPPGVFNLVCGTGKTVGEAIASHPDIDMVSFTGSTRAGKRVAELAAQTVKRVALELGGKSPFVILPGADVDAAVTAGIGSCYMNSGQTCIAWTRMLVPRAQHDEIVAKAKEIAEGFALGDPADETHMGIGPVISDAQRKRVRKYIKKGIEEGATLVTGGPEKPRGFRKGYYVKPTVFANVRNDMTIAQEEIFGPVLSIIPYDDEEDAIRIANDTVYGLHAGVFGPDDESAMRVARRLQAGQVDINGQKFNPLAPFGGYKQSGSGRELGQYGLEEFLEVKSLQL